MSYMNPIGPEEINRRKTHSDIKNQTDDLTFSNRERGSSHGEPTA